MVYHLKTKIGALRYNLPRVIDDKRPSTSEGVSITRSSTVPRDSVSQVKRETGARSQKPAMPVLPPQR